MKLTRLSLYCLDLLTDLSPVYIPRIFNKLYLVILGNHTVYTLIKRYYKSKLKKIKKLDKILIIVDMNIGDTVIVQPSIKVLKFLLPAARIDYACNITSAGLVYETGREDIVIKLYLKNGLPTENEILKLNELLKLNTYDIILNFCPFFSKKEIAGKALIIQIFIPLASYIIHVWKENNEKRHISFSIFNFMLNFFVELGDVLYPDQINVKTVNEPFYFPGNNIIITAPDIEEANNFLRNNRLLGRRGLVLMHPDTPSVYTMIPVNIQNIIIKKILQSGIVGVVLIGLGRSFSHIEDRIIESLSEELKEKVIVIPDFSINTYAALIDASDVFISGDTGPLHIAAARKWVNNNNYQLRNKTAIVTIFGATDPALYGYDSGKRLFQSANQDAPSKVFISPASCRNISCIDKLNKSCRKIRCFNGLNPDEIVDYIITYVKDLRKSENAGVFSGDIT